jgi:endoglucanase
MNAETLSMLKELTEAAGLPGYEGEIRDIVAERLSGLAETATDNLGNIICEKRGTAERPRVMLPGHMDEIGFLVSGVTDDGYLRFTSVGGWWDQVLLAQRVTVKSRKGDYLGIVGSKPPHVLEEDERKKPVQRKDMFIDVGAKDKKEATGKYGIRTGDPVVPICPFEPMRNKKLLAGKAFDDRVGVAMMIDVLRRLARVRHPNTVYGVGTVQEEVGTRGAETASDSIDPDVALILDVGIASDIPGAKAEDKDKGTLGKGPQICFLDAGMIPNLKLRDFLVDLAEDRKIPYQISMLERGATDGRPIHLHGRGVPCVYIGIPTRYIHSHAGILHADDYDNGVKLLVEAIKRLDANTVAALRP